jgi:hypothetical protein
MLGNLGSLLPLLVLCASLLVALGSAGSLHPPAEV